MARYVEIGPTTRGRFALGRPAHSLPAGQSDPSPGSHESSAFAGTRLSVSRLRPENVRRSLRSAAFSLNWAKRWIETQRRIGNSSYSSEPRQRLCAEQHDEWEIDGPYMSAESIARALSHPDDEAEEVIAVEATA